MAKISILAEQNCVASAITGIIDALTIANIWWQFTQNDNEKPLFETEIITVDGKPVTANGGISLIPVKSMHDIGKTDLILLPAFLWPFDLKSSRIKTICQWIIDHHRRGNHIACTCTGTFLLAETGLLNGKIATTNWQFAEFFRRSYPKVNLQIDRMLTIDDGLFCTGATTAFMNLCLFLIEKHGSETLANRCAKIMLSDKNRQHQAPYIVEDFWKNHSDEQILKAQCWMETHYQSKISIDEVAKQFGIGSRHFKRRFKNAAGETPLSYLQRIRIEKAKHCLEHSQDNINEITWQVGYEDVNSFRRLFIKHTGLSPKNYRNKFTSSEKRVSDTALRPA